MEAFGDVMISVFAEFSALLLVEILSVVLIGFGACYAAIGMWRQHRANLKWEQTLFEIEEEEESY